MKGSAARQMLTYEILCELWFSYFFLVSPGQTLKFTFDNFMLNTGNTLVCSLLRFEGVFEYI